MVGRRSGWLESHGGRYPWYDLVRCSSESIDGGLGGGGGGGGGGGVDDITLSAIGGRGSGGGLKGSGASGHGLRGGGSAHSVSRTLSERQ